MYYINFRCSDGRSRRFFGLSTKGLKNRGPNLIRDKLEIGFIKILIKIENNRRYGAINKGCLIWIYHIPRAVVAVVLFSFSKFLRAATADSSPWFYDDNLAVESVLAECRR